jgi:tetratricopeptide (TPR) repeat protein
VRTLLVLAASLLVGASSVASPQLSKEPPRPKLDASADTNDAHAYYTFALGILSDAPDRAADALYWATRIDPTWADPYYTRRVALMVADPGRYRRYSSGDRRAIEEARAIDSLLYRALTINPFLSRRLDKTLLEMVLGGGRPGRVQLDMMVSANWPLAARAWIAYCDGLNDEALRLYGKAIDQDKKNANYRVERARVYFNKNLPDSALADLTVALDEMRKADAKKIVFIYESRAIVEHSLAVVYQRLDKTAEAKAAYGRALEEDLSYYPAHMQLAFMALEAKDTTTALAELDLATQLRGDDPGAQYLQAYALVMAGHVADAEPHIKKAMALDPVYAAPKFLYARLLELADFGDEAVAAYKAFLAAAARNDLRRAEAEAHLAALTKPPHEPLR